LQSQLASYGFLLDRVRGSHRHYRHQRTGRLRRELRPSCRRASVSTCATVTAGSMTTSAQGDAA